jgi:hypothetical protein
MRSSPAVRTTHSRRGQTLKHTSTPATHGDSAGTTLRPGGLGGTRLLLTLLLQLTQTLSLLYEDVREAHSDTDCLAANLLLNRTKVAGR